MDPVVKPFEEITGSVKLSEPLIPFISTVTGREILASEAVSPFYWANHLRATVKFSDAITEVLRESPLVLLEAGPRSTSATLARQQITDFTNHIAISSLSDTHENEAEWGAIMKAVGMLWQCGITIDFNTFYQNEKRKRIPLPSYSFEKIRYWIEPVKKTAVSIGHSNSVSQVQENAISNDESIINEPVEMLSIIKSKILHIVEDISGKTIPSTASNISFIELGFDSLVLTQIARKLTREFKVQISFRQLMETCSSIDVLSEYLDKIIPEDMTATLNVKQSAIHADPTCENNEKSQIQINSNQNSCNSNLESIVIRQMDIIERLVYLLEKNDIIPGDFKTALSEIKKIKTDNSPEERTVSSAKKESGIMHSDKPPVPGARLGKDEKGNPAWYIPDPVNKGKYKKLDN